MNSFNPAFRFISPELLQLPDEYKIILDNLGINYQEFTDLTGNLDDSDIIYVTRIQKERFSDPMEYERVKNSYILRNEMLDNTKPNLRILHPLPRVNEISTDVDDNEKAYYFTQALNGVYARQSIICSILGLK